MILFGAIALGLAAVGIYGVIAYVSSQRTSEVATRLALGAPPSSIFWLMVGQGRALVATVISARSAAPVDPVVALGSD